MTTNARPGGRTPWAAILAIAAAAVVGLVLAVLLLNRPAGLTGASPDPSQSASGAQSATETTSSPPSETSEPTSSSPPAEGFATIVLGEHGAASVATSGPSGAVALGYNDVAPGPVGPAAWFSPDGRDWQPAEVPAGFEDMRPMAVAASESGYVAAMTHCLQECSGGELWYSADGRSWADTPTSLADGLLVHLTAGGPGFVAIGSQTYAAGSPGAIPTVFVSEDGQTWTSGQPAALDGANVHSLTSMGDQIVAIGTQGVEAGSLDATWTTSDGRTWERHDEDSDRASVYDMAWNGSDLLVVGIGTCPGGIGLGDQCPGESNIAWRSSDGRSWAPALADPCCGGLSSVVATPTGWLALVIPAPPGGGSPVALAGRLDQAEWRAITVEADGGELFVHSLAEHDGLVLFVGELRVGDQPRPAIVIANSPLP